MMDEPNTIDSSGPDETPKPESTAPGTPAAEPVGQAPSDSDHSTTIPPADAAPAASETADEKKARLIAEAKTRAAAAKETAATTPPGVSSAAPAAPKAPVKKKEEGPTPKDASDHPLVKRLRAALNGAIVESAEFLTQLGIRIDPPRIVEACEFLKRDGESPFNYLSDLTCVHFPERPEAPFEIVYNLYSISANSRVRLYVATTEEGVESVTSVWPAANWMEREVYDLFGVRFHNHPDLRRLLLPLDWEGHPFRKDYPLKPVENAWTAKHLPPFDNVQKEQLEQRRAYGLEVLSHPDERRIREIFIGGKEVMPLDRK